MGYFGNPAESVDVIDRGEPCEVVGRLLKLLVHLFASVIAPLLRHIERRVSRVARRERTGRRVRATDIGRVAMAEDVWLVLPTSPVRLARRIVRQGTTNGEVTIGIRLRPRCTLGAPPGESLASPSRNTDVQPRGVRSQAMNARRCRA